MSTASQIADLILRKGEIAGQGAANQGAIWGGTLRDLGQTVTALPTYVQNQRARDLENQGRVQEGQLRSQEMQMRGVQMDQLQRAQQSQDAAAKVVAGFPRKADGTYDVGGMIQQMSAAGVHPTDVEHFGSTIEKLNQLSMTAADAQRQHQARAADIILAGAQGQEISPEDVHVALATLKTLPGGLVDDEDEAAWTKAFANGANPRQFLQSVSQAGKVAEKAPTNDAELAYLAAGGSQRAKTALDLAKPPKPASGISNEIELRQDAATQGTSEETPTAWRSVETLRQMDEAKAKAPAAQKSLQQKTVILDGKRKEVLFDPDPAATQKVFDLDGKPMTNAAQRISGLPTAAEQRPEAGTQPEVQIKPGTQAYRAAQDIAYGALTMADFNRIYGRAMGNAATKLAVYDKARELNPDFFNPAQFELGFKMASNPQIRQRVVAIDALGPVIDKIKELSSQVGNGDVQLFNRLLQGAKLQISNKTVSNFQQLKTLLGDEAGIALGVGTGSDLKTKMGLDLVNTNLSDGTFQSNMDQLDAILGARKGLLLKQMGPYAGAAGGNTSAPVVPPVVPQSNLDVLKAKRKALGLE